MLRRTLLCANTNMSSAVIDFWFGGPAASLWGPRDVSKVAPMWYGMKSDFSGPASDADKAAADAACREYIDLIREAGKEGGLAEWEETDEGLYAKMLLCDQLPRNAFRGSGEAFAYDGVGVKCARELVKRKAYEKFESMCYFSFLTTPGQHSEDVTLHDMNLGILDYVKGAEKFAGDRQVGMLEQYVKEHADLCKRFGRYPWRNEAMGRESTEEEKAWLADYDNLPSFAKSQMAKK